MYGPFNEIELEYKPNLVRLVGDFNARIQQKDFFHENCLTFIFECKM
jgi:hypothetical protein